jgi:hypothetical protein
MLKGGAGFERLSSNMKMFERTERIPRITATATPLIVDSGESIFNYEYLLELEAKIGKA